VFFTSPLAGEVKNEWHLAIHSRERGLVRLRRNIKKEEASLLFYIPLSPPPGYPVYVFLIGAGIQKIL
jgi:hypothetical protein